MIKYTNKKMTLVMNKMSISHAGGISTSGSNIRHGQSLGFIDRIFENEIFGEQIYPDIFHQAAAYMFYIIKNHVFLDGNKRTALAVAVTFLQSNGYMFLPFNEDKVFEFVTGIASGENNPDTVIPVIADWFKELSVY